MKGNNGRKELEERGQAQAQGMCRLTLNVQPDMCTVTERAQSAPLFALRGPSKARPLYNCHGARGLLQVMLLAVQDPTNAMDHAGLSRVLS